MRFQVVFTAKIIRKLEYIKINTGMLVYMIASFVAKRTSDNVNLFSEDPGT